MHRSLIRTTPLLAAALLVNACAGATTGTRQPRSGVVCEDGRPVLIVRNDSGMTLQIVESRIGSGGRMVIREIGPGRHEIDVRNDWTYSYSAQRAGGGNTLAATSWRGQPDRSVTLDRECRPA